MFQRLFNLPLDGKDSLFVFGPRGTGKTAWLRENLSQREHIYLDLLDGALFRELVAKPERLRELIPEGYSGWVVIDEVQKVPELLDEVHKLIESNRVRFILTGSSARKLKRDGVNLLAGRAIRYTMRPLTYQELGEAFSLEHALTLGMLPATYHYDDPSGYLTTYIDTYMREEVQQEGLTRNISAFSRFLEVASFSQGSTVNYAEVAREVGVNRQMIKSYFSILEDLLLASWLPIFSKRAKRKLISSEKFYLFDAGVYQNLRPKGILDSPDEVAGASLETLFYQSIMALNAYKKLGYKLYYWRTVAGVEVDFVLYGQDKLIAVEVKHSKVVQPKMLKGLKEFKKDYPEAECYLLYLGSETLYLADKTVTAMPFSSRLQSLVG